MLDTAQIRFSGLPATQWALFSIYVTQLRRDELRRVIQNPKFVGILMPRTPLIMQVFDSVCLIMQCTELQVVNYYVQLYMYWVVKRTENRIPALLEITWCTIAKLEHVLHIQSGGYTSFIYISIAAMCINYTSGFILLTHNVLYLNLRRVNNTDKTVVLTFVILNWSIVNTTCKPIVNLIILPVIRVGELVNFHRY